MSGRQSQPDIVESGPPGRRRAHLRAGPRRPGHLVVVVVLVAAVAVAVAGLQWARHAHARARRAARDAAVVAALAAVRAAPAGYDRSSVDVALYNPTRTALRIRAADLRYGSRSEIPGRPVGRTSAGAGFRVAAGASAVVRFAVSGTLACWAPSGQTPVLRLRTTLPGGAVRAATVRIGRAPDSATGAAWRTALGSFECTFDAPRP